MSQRQEVGGVVVVVGGTLSMSPSRGEICLGARLRVGHQSLRVNDQL